MKSDQTDRAYRYYYLIKPFIPRRLQIEVRSWVAKLKSRRCKDIWPIDRDSAQSPDGWRGWPDNKNFALVLTHDVDTYKGHEKCLQLLQLEEREGFRSSYNFVAAEYRVKKELRHHIAAHGFEVGVHGLVHNHSLYDSEATFQKHAERINHFLNDWGAAGFRSPCMYHNLDWLQYLNIDYDASTFDTDPFEPQPDNVGTIFPFCVEGTRGRKGYVELPYTLPQDFTLFILLKEQTINIWKNKIDWIASNGGMALLNTHPDYMNFENENKSFEEYRANLYRELLIYIREQYAGQYWHVLPQEMAKFWRARSLPLRSDYAEPGGSGKTSETGYPYVRM